MFLLQANENDDPIEIDIKFVRYITYLEDTDFTILELTMNRKELDKFGNSLSKTILFIPDHDLNKDPISIRLADEYCRIKDIDDNLCKIMYFM